MSQMETWLLHRGAFGRKTVYIHPSIKTLIVQNFQENVIRNDSPRWSKWCFPVTTVLTCCVLVKIGNHIPQESYPPQVPVLWFFASKSDSPRESELFFYVEFRRYSIPYSAPTIGITFSIKVSTEILFQCRGSFDSKTIDIGPCIKLLMVQNFQEVVIKNESSRWPKWCFSVTTVLTSFVRVKIGNHIPQEVDPSQVSIFWFFASKSDNFSLLTFVDIQYHNSL